MRNRAFSLLELVIAMAIMGIALLGLIQMFPVGLKASKRAGDHTIMAFLGQQKMSDIEQKKYDETEYEYMNANDVSDLVTYSALTASDHFFSSPYENFSWSFIISQNHNNIDNLYHVTLAIYSNCGADTKIEEFVTSYVK
ncbi:prepilin-type N-terminal cleavage/methylation domain-containing protein [bacterium]|nr:prepilin-type N-terminal cleavage/methylation domain-containing protein [bacterium]